MPPFRLPGVDGREHAETDYARAKALLIMFICNHCPYVKAIEDRLIELGKRAQANGAAIVAICSNDPEEYPEDRFDRLKARWEDKKYPFPYLHDETQAVARSFGAVCTPDFFLYDGNRRLVYRGRLDDSWKDPAKVRRRELEDAINEVLAGGTPPLEQTPSMGCSIKWL